jgi:hypothetical protein
VVTFERIGGGSGIIGVAAIATQFILTGTAAPDAASLLQHRLLWEWATLLRAVGGLGIVWFTAALAARLRRRESPASGAAMLVIGSGVLWGSIWLVSAAFNSTAISLATTYDDPARVRLMAVFGVQSVLVLTPVLSIAFLVATGIAVLAAPTFPRRFAYAAFAAAIVRFIMAIADWQGRADLAMRIVDLTLMWVVVTAIHLLGATRPLELHEQDA